MRKIDKPTSNTRVYIDREEGLLPFWPVIKLTQSPSSICKLLWHMKFSNRIFWTMPALERRRLSIGSAMAGSVHLGSILV